MGDLAVELENLRGQLATTNTAMKLGFTRIEQKVDALTKAFGDHQHRCVACEAGLRAEILANERAARKREQEIAKDMHKEAQALEKRVRSLEVSRSVITALVGFAGALAGVFLGPMVRVLIGKVLS